MSHDNTRRLSIFSTFFILTQTSMQWMINRIILNMYTYGTQNKLQFILVCVCKSEWSYSNTEDTHVHIHHFNGQLPCKPKVAGCPLGRVVVYRVVDHISPTFNNCHDYISRSFQVTVTVCWMHSCCPTNSIKALEAYQSNKGLQKRKSSSAYNIYSVPSLCLQSLLSTPWTFSCSGFLPTRIKVVTLKKRYIIHDTIDWWPSQFPATRLQICIHINATTTISCHPSR